MSGTERPPEAIAEEICDMAGALPVGEGRRFIAIAGAPGSGKSTVSQAVMAAFARRGVPAGLLAMDGFHLDNRILDARGLRPRKGAPETFDLDGFRAMVERLAAGGPVAVPIFDRGLDKSIAAAEMIPEEARIVVAEGNYLLLDEPGWRDLRPLWDIAVVLASDEAELEARLMQRWRDHGFDEDGARAKVMENDLPNARRVLAHIVPDVDMRL